MTANARAAGRQPSRLLEVMHVANTSVHFKPFETVFAQGDSCTGVMYIQTGRVTLTTTSRQGHAAVVGTLAAGAFFGEGALAGQRRRRATAKTTTGSTIGIVKTSEMRRCLHEETAFADWFRSHLLATNIRIEADLVDQFFNRTEKRLARALLLLAHFDEHQSPRHALPRISRDLLAEMTGTSRSRVDILMNEFRKLGFLERHREQDGGLQVHCSMLSVVLQD
jgi:CRP/FNR family transcriptional regulator, cyclic AMP receptor protein